MTCRSNNDLKCNYVTVWSRIAQSLEHSLCKRGIPGSSPGLTAHFSPPVIFGAERGAVHASLDSLRRAENIYLRNSRTRITNLWGCIWRFWISHHRVWLHILQYNYDNTMLSHAYMFILDQSFVLHVETPWSYSLSQEFRLNPAHD